MAFDPVAYKGQLSKKIHERYTLREVDPTGADISQSDLGLGSAQPQQSNQAQPTAPNQQQKPSVQGGKPENKELSMELLKAVIDYVVAKKDDPAAIEMLKNNSKNDLINLFQSGTFDQTAGSNTPAGANNAPKQNPETTQATGEPGADDLSGLTQPEAPPADSGNTGDTGGDAGGGDTGGDTGGDAGGGDTGGDTGGDAGGGDAAPEDDIKL